MVNILTYLVINHLRNHYKNTNILREMKKKKTTTEENEKTSD